MTIFDNIAAFLEKATWSTSAVNDLPDSSFLFVEGGGDKDSGGKTTPRSLRHLPVKGPDGKYDIAHVRNAIQRAPQIKLKDGSKISSSKAKSLQNRAQKILDGLKKSDDELVEKEWLVELSKDFADDEQRLIYGVVMVPGTPDTQGDIASEHEIEKAAHAFFLKSRVNDLQHKEMLSEDRATPVESYVAPVDMKINDKVIKQGSWVLVTYVPDDDIWGDIKKGNIMSYSIMGYGKRIPLEA